MALDTERYWDLVAGKISTRTGSSERALSGNLGAIGRYKRSRFLASLDTLDLERLDVLEIGHGAGGNCERLHELGARVRGVDISAEMVRIAQVRNAAWCAPDTFLHSPGDQLPFEDNSFDLVVTVTVLQHNLQDVTVEKTLREMRRILRPSGRVVIFEDTLMRRREDFSWVGRTRQEYESLAVKAGLKLSRFEMIGLSYFWALNRLRRLSFVHRPFVRATEDTMRAQPGDESSGEGQRVRGLRGLAESMAVAITSPIDRIVEVPEGLARYHFRRA